jgi:hypothetical protein
MAVAASGLRAIRRLATGRTDGPMILLGAVWLGAAVPIGAAVWLHLRDLGLEPQGARLARAHHRIG